MEKTSQSDKLLTDNDNSHRLSSEARENITAIIMMVFTLPIWIYGGEIFTRYFIGPDLSLIQKISYIVVIYVSTYIYLIVGVLILSMRWMIVKIIGLLLFCSPAFIFYIAMFIMGLYGTYNALFNDTDNIESGLIYELSIAAKLFASDVFNKFGRVVIWTPLIGVASFIFAIILFKIRKSKKMIYGSAEVLFGVITIIASTKAVLNSISPGDFLLIFYDYSTIISQPWQGQMLIQFVGGVYIIIRGMDNIDKAFDEEISAKTIVKGDLVWDLYDIWAALFRDKNVLYDEENINEDGKAAITKDTISADNAPDDPTEINSGSKILEIEDNARSGL